MAETLQLIITADNKEALKAIEDLAKSTEGLKTKFSTLGSASNQANQALVNSGRVLQDLNYGFMGVANNLNPLLESFQRLSEKSKDSGTSVKKELIAALTGPAGLGVALSAVTFIFLKFGDEISAFFTKLITGNDILKSQKEALAGVGSEFTNAVEKVEKVSVAFKEYHSGILTGNQALKIYNDELGKNFGVKSNINEAEQTFKDKTAAYVEASFQRALADSASKKAAEELLKQRLLQAQGPQVKVQDYLSVLSPLGIIDPTKTVSTNAKGRYTQDVNDLEKLINQYREIALQAKSASDLFAKGFDLNLNPNKAGGVTDMFTNLNKELNLELFFLKQMRDHLDKIAQPVLTYGDKEVTKARKEDAKLESERLMNPNENSIGKYLKGITANLAPAIAMERLLFKEQAEGWDKSKKLAYEFADAMSSTITNSIAGVFNALKQGENVFEALGNAVLQFAEDLTFAIIKAQILASIQGALTISGAGTAGAAAGGTGFWDLIMGIIGADKKHADGGIVTSPQIGMIGEAGAEAIMPLSKLSGMLNTTFNAGAMNGGGMANGGQFVLKGNDLVLALQRSNYSLNLRRGI